MYEFGARNVYATAFVSRSLSMRILPGVRVRLVKFSFGWQMLLSISKAAEPDKRIMDLATAAAGGEAVLMAVIVSLKLYN